MTRILSYNILVGGKRRVDQLTKIMSSAHPDIVLPVVKLSRRWQIDWACNIG